LFAKNQKGLKLYYLQDCIFKLLTDSFSNKNKGRLILARQGAGLGRASIQAERQKEDNQHFL
jgi:hypothetical protein